MSTSLSRHLFRIDEVAASLRYALIERRMEEGMYWTEELIDSEEYGLLLRIITDVWVFSQGPFTRLSLLPAIAAATHAPSAVALRLLSFSILRTPKSIADGSVLAIAALALEDLRAPSLEFQMANMNLHGSPQGPDAGLAAAIERGDVRAAARHIFKGATVTGLILERRAYTAAVRRLEGAAVQAGSPIWHALWSIIDVMILLMTPKQFADATVVAPAVELSETVQEWLADWRAVVGRRQRRRFKVQTVAIKWLTTRGRMSYKESTVGELLRGDVWRLLEGCKYWDRKAVEFGICGGLSAAVGAIDEETQDALEGFINFAFPDDIPDEWSVAARELSYGDGFLVPGAAPSRANWLRSWMPDKAVAVGAKELANTRQVIESSSVGGYYMDEWLATNATASNQFSNTR